MKEQEETAEKEKRGVRLELSRTALFFWSLGLLILLGWIFTLGVLAGRGLLPSGAETLAELKSQIVKLQEMVGQKDSSELERIKGVQKDPEFGFYDELSSKKMTVVQPKSEPPPKRPIANNAAQPEPASPASARYVVQVASLDNEKQALEMVNRLVKGGYPAYHYKIFIKGRSYFRVRCGTFKTRAEAVNVQGKLADKERMKGYVQKVDGQ